VSGVAYARAEIEQTFIAFRAALERAMRSGDWSEWARFYTEDAVYVEHAMGTFRGRRAIHDWILATMALPLVRDIESFPIGWHVICEPGGRAAGLRWVARRVVLSARLQASAWRVMVSQQRIEPISSAGPRDALARPVAIAHFTSAITR
jgi:hypothetical protein